MYRCFLDHAWRKRGSSLRIYSHVLNVSGMSTTTLQTRWLQLHQIAHYTLQVFPISRRILLSILGASVGEPDVLVGASELHELLADLFVGAVDEEVPVALRALELGVEGVGEGGAQHALPGRVGPSGRQRLREFVGEGGLGMPADNRRTVVCDHYCWVFGAGAGG